MVSEMMLHSVSSSKHEQMDTVKFLNFRMPKKLCCNPPKIQEKRPNLWVFYHKDANEIANSEDPDQTAPPGAV